MHVLCVHQQIQVTQAKLGEKPFRWPGVFSVQTYPCKSLFQFRLGKVFPAARAGWVVCRAKLPSSGRSQECRAPSAAWARGTPLTQGCKQSKAEANTAYLYITSTRGSITDEIVCNENNDNDVIELPGSYNCVVRAFSVFPLFS